MAVILSLNFELNFEIQHSVMHRRPKLMRQLEQSFQINYT